MSERSYAYAADLVAQRRPTTTCRRTRTVVSGLLVAPNGVTEDAVVQAAPAADRRAQLDDEGALVHLATLAVGPRDPRGSGGGAPTGS
jgi:hypothetical protein